MNGHNISVSNAAQQALPPDAAALRFAAQVKRRPLSGIARNSCTKNSSSTTMRKLTLILLCLMLTSCNFQAADNNMSQLKAVYFVHE
jgi:hypothetical protein